LQPGALPDRGLVTVIEIPGPGSGLGVGIFPGRQAVGVTAGSRRGEVSMAIRVKARSGESVEQMLRRFKKLCEKEGLTKDIKRREFYEKPSERRRRDMRKCVNRRTRDEMGPIKPVKPERT
jgi:small subunit ribosomal protein S21